MKESFNELYTRLYRENFNELEVLRKKERMTILPFFILFIAAVIVGVINIKYMPAIMMVMLLYIVVKICKSLKENKGKKTYRTIFKEKIIGPIIENVFEGATYDPHKGIDRREYTNAGYPDWIDRYTSEDLIVAPLNIPGEKTTIITFSEVHTERRHEDKDGHTSYSTEFNGLAGSFLIPKDTNNKMYIRANGLFSKFTKRRVNMDMSEFEKIFDVESEDKILAMRILTSDVMTEMIDIYTKYKYRFEISIINDKVYMRLHTGAMFEPAIFKESIEYKQLEKYYSILKALTNVSEHIYDTILKLEL